MEKKILDFTAFKIEKALKEEGYTIKIDKKKKIKLLLKITK